MFENLSKKLTDLGTDAASRAKNIGDRVSVTAKIEAAKRELTGVYAQLGHKLYQSQQDDIPAEYADLFEKIDAAEKKLETLQAQRQVLRQVRPCPDCGADVPNDAEFCAKCGCHIGAVSEEAQGEEDFDDFFEDEMPKKDVPAEDAPAEDAPADSE